MLISIDVEVQQSQVLLKFSFGWGMFLTLLSGVIRTLELGL